MPTLLTRLFLVLLGLIFAELYVLVWLSKSLGIFTTLAMVLGAGILGAGLARQQGWIALHRIRAQLAAGQTPTHDIRDGLLILVAGVLLILPGFLSDIAGILLLIPQVRTVVSQGLLTWYRQRTVARFRNQSADASPYQPTHPPQGEIIDVEFTRIPLDQGR